MTHTKKNCPRGGSCTCNCCDRRSGKHCGYHMHGCHMKCPAS